MPKKCERQPPRFRVSAHLPSASWHPHQDWTFTNKASTEWGAWTLMMRDSLMRLTGGNMRLMVGYWADALNSLPDDVRTALISVIAQGLGLSIKPAEDAPDTIEITLVPRYEPLVGEKKTASGLVLPKGPGSDLLLPGQKGYNE